MRIYRVESSFSIMRDSSSEIVRGECIQTTPYSGIPGVESILWLSSHGISSAAFRHHKESNKNIPLPSQDKLLVKNATKAIQTKWDRPDYKNEDEYIPSWLIHLYHFAFASEYDMMRWFTREEREELSSKGFYIAVYEIPEDEVIIGDRQLMFRKSHAELVDFIEMRKL